MEKSFGIVLVACLMAGALAGAATMEVASITVSSLPGSITIPVSLNAEAPFASFQFTLRYNSSILKLVSVDKGPLVAGFTVVNNTSVAGIVRTGGFDPTLSGVSGSGVIANLQCEVLTPGYSYLSLTEVKLSDSLGKSLPCSVRSGFFRVTSTPSQSGNGTAANADATATTISTGSGQASVAVASSGGVSGYTRVQVGETAVSLPAANIPAVPRWEGQPVPGTTIATPGRTTAPPVIPEPGKPPVETPTNSVVLLVKSDYGKTFPVPGVTTYTRGDKVDCRVETAVLVEGQEQIVCTGYEGTGSAPTGSGTSVSFTIREDSKLTWKWEKKPLKKEFIFSCPEKMNFSLQEKELKIPVKVIFLAGFAEPVAVKARVPSGFQIEPAQKELRVEGNEAIFAVRRGPKVLAGNYTLEFEGMAGKVQKTTRVVLTVSGEAK
ncbi:MAG TPA: cohesin domain-containing protein, partial [bacterium]|nr:cohesin domain-containing protein [bacterium]